MRSLRFIAVILLVFFAVAHIEATEIKRAGGRKNGKKSAYKKFQSLQRSTLRHVCHIIFIDTKPTVTVSVTKTNTFTQATFTSTVITTSTVTPSTSTAVQITTDGTRTVTSTPNPVITTLTTTTVTSLTTGASVHRRSESKAARRLAHDLLFLFGSTLAREVCVDLVYGGNSTLAPAYSSTTTVLANKTLVAPTVTVIRTQTQTAPVPIITNQQHVTATATTTLIPSTSTTYATSTTYETVSINPQSVCGAQSPGCICTVSSDGLGVTCAFSVVGQPALFVAPCKGTLAATLQGGAQGIGFYASPNYDVSFGSIVESSGVARSGNSATVFPAGETLQVRVGGNGGAGSGSTSGAGGYNGGGSGGAFPDYQYYGGGGGGATDIIQQSSGLVLLAAGGAGGQGEEPIPASSPDANSISSATAPQAQNANTNRVSPTGGGGGGGYPGGFAGFYDQSAGSYGFSLYNAAAGDQLTVQTTSGSSSAVLTYRCTI